LSERSDHLRERNRRIMRLLLNPSLLTGRVAVYTCRKRMTNDERPNDEGITNDEYRMAKQ
jgi:hypothetical protein